MAQTVTVDPVFKVSIYQYVLHQHTCSNVPFYICTFTGKLVQNEAGSNFWSCKLKKCKFQNSMQTKNYNIKHTIFSESICWNPKTILNMLISAVLPLDYSQCNSYFGYVRHSNKYIRDVYHNDYLHQCNKCLGYKILI